MGNSESHITVDDTIVNDTIAKITYDVESFLSKYEKYKFIYYIRFYFLMENIDIKECTIKYCDSYDDLRGATSKVLSVHFLKLYQNKTHPNKFYFKFPNRKIRFKLLDDKTIQHLREMMELQIS